MRACPSSRATQACAATTLLVAVHGPHPMRARGKSSPAGLLNALPTPQRPWFHIVVDVILTIVDRFSKELHVVQLPELPSVAKTRDLLVCCVNHVFRLHGILRDIITDRGPQFTSRVWWSFFNGESLIRVPHTVKRPDGKHEPDYGEVCGCSLTNGLEVLVTLGGVRAQLPGVDVIWDVAVQC